MSEKYTGKYLKDNDWSARCDVCGLFYFGSTMKMRWDGLFVDDDCWEPYPDGYKSKVIREDRTVPETRELKFDPTQDQMKYQPITADNDGPGFLYVLQEE